MKLESLKAAALVAAFMLSLGTVSASAATIPFSGQWDENVGLSGTIDPGGLPFLANGNGTNSWGVPGVSAGTLAWSAGDGFRDFHIQFTLPDGIFIDGTFGNTCDGGPGGGTVFCSSPFDAADVWEPDLTGPVNSISFFADGVTLDNGDTFFVNILFTGLAPAGSFVGSWTMDGGLIPEPGTLALVGLALAGLGFAGRRQRG